MKRLIVAAAAALLLCVPAMAQTAAPIAPIAGDWLGGIVSLWGPLLAVIVALVMFFDKLAKVIPNSTTSGVLTVIRKIASVLGAKVPDVQ